MIEEVFYITADPYGDLISLVFTDNINRSIKGVCHRVHISPKRYVVPKHSTAVVCDVEEKRKDNGELYRATWIIFDVAKYNTGVVVHECLHLTYGILAPRGLHLNDHAEESYAYMIQWLYNRITEHYRQVRMLIKRKPV